jgi:hypothetical protein
VIGAAVLIAVVSMAVTVWRLQRRYAVEDALGRGLQRGAPLVQVTDLLRRLGVPFTVDSATRGATVVRAAREVARDGTVTELHINFDARERLHDAVTITRISGR